MKRFDTIHLDNRYMDAVPPIEDSKNSAIFPYLLSYISIELLLCAVITVIAIVVIESKRYDLPPPQLLLLPSFLHLLQQTNRQGGRTYSLQIYA